MLEHAEQLIIGAFPAQGTPAVHPWRRAIPNLRESYAATAMAGLGWDENKEKAIDRTAAGGFASPLSMNLWRAKYQLSAESYKSASAELLEIAMSRYLNVSRETLAKLVDQSLHEYLSSNCRQCKGIGEMVVNELRVVCPTCNGSKMHRFSDAERSSCMKLSYALTKTYAKKLAWMGALLQRYDTAANAVLCHQLGRV